MYDCREKKPKDKINVPPECTGKFLFQVVYTLVKTEIQ